MKISSEQVGAKLTVNLDDVKDQDGIIETIAGCAEFHPAQY